MGIEDTYRNLQRENLELSKQIFVWKAKFETLQYVFMLIYVYLTRVFPEVGVQPFTRKSSRGT